MKIMCKNGMMLNLLAIMGNVSSGTAQRIIERWTQCYQNSADYKWN